MFRQIPYTSPLGAVYVRSGPAPLAHGPFPAALVVVALELVDTEVAVLVITAVELVEITELVEPAPELVVEPLTGADEVVLEVLVVAEAVDDTVDAVV